MNNIERRTRAAVPDDRGDGPPLDERIAAALKADGAVAVEELRDLLAAIENAIREGAYVVRHEHDRSLDPSSSPVERDQAAQRSASADSRLAEILQQERR